MAPVLRRRPGPFLLVDHTAKINCDGHRNNQRRQPQMPLPPRPQRPPNLGSKPPPRERLAASVTPLTGAVLRSAC